MSFRHIRMVKGSLLVSYSDSDTKDFFIEVVIRNSVVRNN